MKRLTRKQREIKARDELILDIATRLIAKDGFFSLNMDRIAEEAEYSKGTIYQHYSCKEEVLMGVCLRGMQVWKSLFARALKFQGRSRERLLAFHLGHHFYARLHPVEYDAVYLVKSSGVREKISEVSHGAQNKLIRELLDMTASVVQEAIATGDLKLPGAMRSQDLVYGFWSSHYGSLMFQTYDFPYGRMGIGNQERNRRLLLRAILDGIGWRPLSSKFDYDAAAECIIKELYPDEQTQLESSAKRLRNNSN